jgi:hypothetical protein
LAAIHGSVALSAFGVAGADDYIDATNVDWGDPSGPAPIGTGVGYSGSGVSVAHWVGWVQPSPRVSTSTYASQTTDCRKLVFIGVRGTLEEPQGEDPVFSGPADGMGTRLFDTQFALRDEFDAYPGFGVDGTDDIKNMAVHYFADDHDLVGLATGEYVDSIYDGVGQLMAMLNDETNKCKDVTDEKFVLAGYSKGALIIHIAMRKLEVANPAMFNRIAGIAMIADPAKVSYGAEYTLEEFNKEAGGGVSEADGLWSQYFVGDDVGQLPPAVTGKTIAICRNHDIVCAPPSPGSFGAQVGGVASWPGLNYKVDVHTDDYYKTKTDVLGRWIADKYMGQTFTLGT